MCKDNLINKSIDTTFAEPLFLKCCRNNDIETLKYLFSIEKYCKTKIDIMAVDYRSGNSFFAITSNWREFEPLFDFLVNTVYKGNKKVIEKLINSRSADNTTCPLLNICEILHVRPKEFNISQVFKKLLLFGANPNLQLKVRSYSSRATYEPAMLQIMRKLVQSTNSQKEYKDRYFQFDDAIENTNKDHMNILKLFINTNNEKTYKYCFDWVCCNCKCPLCVCGLCIGCGSPATTNRFNPKERKKKKSQLCLLFCC